MNKILLIFSIVFLLAGAAGAVDMSTVIAYPVPYNPRQDGGLNIHIPDSDNPDPSTDTFTVSISIYDINGDLVVKRSYAAAAYSGVLTFSNISWNGRNSRGSIVKPGLYIIKIIIQDDSIGDYGKKIIRILVKG